MTRFTPVVLAAVSGWQLLSTAMPLSAEEPPAWRTCESTNFFVCTRGDCDPRDLARHCESLRTDLYETWSEEGSASTWDSRCHVVLHSTRSSYLRAVGRGAERTVGSSLIRRADGRIATRRIDLRGDRPDPLENALPHEMMHLVVGDLLAGIPTPRWVDEGLAVLQDPLAKRAGHEAELAAALLADRQIQVADLLNALEYPPARDFGVFYGQSASLAEYLVARGSAPQFIAFVRLASDEGYDQALSEQYGIRHLRHLETLWRDAQLESLRPRNTQRVEPRSAHES